MIASRPEYLSGQVAITIVTYNSGLYIKSCLESVLAQTYRPVRVVVVDNASTDSTIQVLRGFGDTDLVRIILNGENAGFAAGQNQAIVAARPFDWVLTLNPDVRLTPDFLAALLAEVPDENIGSLCGKLLSALPNFAASSERILDSTGIYFTPELRHLDRGNRTPDRGQYGTPEYVVGGTGAACLYRRLMIDDISISGEFFDADFFAYREDADVAWRAQLLGWKCLYVPAAVADHVRTVTPEKRRSLPPVINMHSVKNRWLMRIKNVTPALYRRYWLPITVRDMVVIGGCLLREWSSLPAFVLVLRLWRRTWAKRREIMQRKRASDEDLDAWFSEKPASFPLHQTR